MDKRQFETWWPDVSDRLTATLTRRGVSAADAADAVQETAMRALAAMPDVATVDDFARWAYTVARRQCIDSYRRARRAAVVPLHLVHEQPNADRLAAERVVEGKLDLQRTLRAIASLSPADRQTLMAALDRPLSAAVDRKTAVREAVRLHRARTRLMSAVEKLTAAFGFGWKGLRKIFGVEAARTATAVGVAMLVMGGLAPQVQAPRDPGAELDPYTTEAPATRYRVEPAVAITELESDQPGAARALSKKPAAAPTTSTTQPPDEEGVIPTITVANSPPGGSTEPTGGGVPDLGDLGLGGGPCAARTSAFKPC